ncbi:MAG: threonine/serine dehydratase [Thaumarchaeota archaeon]|nr:threonine/serine dehydratase [Nitrososphaerota archaeon]
MVRVTATLPTLRDIERAEARIRRFIPPTPLEHSTRLSEELGKDVRLKLEVFHPIRVFKIRGALNRLQTLGDSALRLGVITASSGNHGFAVAYVSRLLGVKATVCVPVNANTQKVDAILEQGAEVIQAGSGYDETYTHAREVASKRGLTFIPAFDDPEIIAGQGTCGLEMARQAPDMDSAVVAIGGGGLISGISIALKESVRGVKVFGAETFAIPSMQESLKAGRRVSVTPQKTIADGMQASTPGELTFEACRRNLDGIDLVSDEEIEDAIFDLLVKARVLAEPAGASPLAAARGPLNGKVGEKVVLVISGGNISASLLSSVLRKRAT